MDRERELERQVVALREENAILRGIVDGESPAWNKVAWLMTKINNQRIALDSLQKKGVNHTRKERIENGIVEPCQDRSQMQTV